MALFEVTAGSPGSAEELHGPTQASDLRAELEADAGEPIRTFQCRLIPFGDGERIEFGDVLEAGTGTWAQCAGDSGSFFYGWQIIVAGDGYVWWYGRHWGAPGPPTLVSRFRESSWTAPPE